MTHEIVIDWADLLAAGLAFRALGLVFGCILLIHIVCMATKMSPKAPWILAILLGCSAATAFGMILGALAGDFMFLANSAIMTIGADTARQLYLWHKGMHVSDFIEKTYG